MERLQGGHLAPMEPTFEKDAEARGSVSLARVTGNACSHPNDARRHRQKAWLTGQDTDGREPLFSHSAAKATVPQMCLLHLPRGGRVNMTRTAAAIQEHVVVKRPLGRICRPTATVRFPTVALILFWKF